MRDKAIRLKSGSFLKNIGTLLAGNVGAQIISVCAIPIISRIYAPEHFGILSILTAPISILAASISLRLDFLVAIEKDILEAKKITSIGLRICLILSIVSGLVSSAFLLYFFQDARQEFGLYLIPLITIGLLSAGLYNIGVSAAIRTQNVRGIAETKVMQSLTGAASQIIFGLAGFKSFGLFLGQILSQSFGFWRLLYHGKLIDAKSLNPKVIILFLRSRSKFIINTNIAAVANNIAIFIPTLMLLKISGPLDAGMLLMAQRIAGLPVDLLVTSVTQAYLSEVARIDKNKKLYNLFCRTSIKLINVSIVYAVAIFLISRYASDLFGEEWDNLGYYMNILLPLYVSKVIVSPLSQTLVVIGRSNVIMKLDLLRLGIVIFIFSYLQHQEVSSIVLIYSVSMCIMYALYLITTVRYLKKEQHAN